MKYIKKNWLFVFELIVGLVLIFNMSIVSCLLWWILITLMEINHKLK